MIAFIRFLSLLFLIELTFMYVIFLNECYRLIFQSNRVNEEERQMTKRRILKELSINTLVKFNNKNNNIFIIELEFYFIGLIIQFFDFFNTFN
jgi:hypothetical protein